MRGSQQICTLQCARVALRSHYPSLGLLQSTNEQQDLSASSASASCLTSTNLVTTLKSYEPNMLGVQQSPWPIARHTHNQATSAASAPGPYSVLRGAHGNSRIQFWRSWPVVRRHGCARIPGATGIAGGMRSHSQQPGQQPAAAVASAASFFSVSESDKDTMTAQSEREQMARELHSLNVAILANILIFSAKIWVHLITGSSAMLAEGLHSVADIFNQLLLRVGVVKAMKAPTPQHPYGYMRDRFVFSLISAVGIFFLGAGASVIHGLHTLVEPQLSMEGVMYTYLVLGISGLLEGYSLWVATRYIMAGAAARRMRTFEYIKSGVDPTTVAVMLEDGGAVMGLAIAGVCTALAHATGNAMFDAAGSIMVGGLLGMIAWFLVQRNRDLLLGRSMSQRELEPVVTHLAADPVIAYVTEMKTEEIGPRVFRFKAEVAWNGDALIDRYMARCGRQVLQQQLAAAMASPNPEAAVEAVLKGYGRDIISAVGAEVDRIEVEIQRINPGIRWVDLETDRGRSQGMSMGMTLYDAAASSAAPSGAGTSAGSQQHLASGSFEGAGAAAAARSSGIGGQPCPQQAVGTYVCSICQNSPMHLDALPAAAAPTAAGAPPSGGPSSSGSTRPSSSAGGMPGSSAAGGILMTPGAGWQQQPPQQGQQQGGMRLMHQAPEPSGSGSSSSSESWGGAADWQQHQHQQPVGGQQWGQLQDASPQHVNGTSPTDRKLPTE